MRVETYTSDGAGNTTLVETTTQAVPATPEAIRFEAQRRIMALVGATDLNACLIKQLNAQMRASELIDKKASGTLTQAEQAEAAALASLAAGIKLIRQRSNELEASPLADWQEDARWA